jgi:predicted nucleotide-binding protein
MFAHAFSIDRLVFPKIIGAQARSAMNDENDSAPLKPSLAIFSSRSLIPVANGVRENLRREFEVTPWTEGFFRSNELSLNTFLKQLLCFDGAVVLLGADDTQVTSAGNVMVPRDNVIFELGACMARFGTQKTFFICPEKPQISLPSYFQAFYPLTYEGRSDNYQAATGAACCSIVDQFKRLKSDAYASDLPAQGLAIGYFNNFLDAVYKRLYDGRAVVDAGVAGVEWREPTPWEINVVMPKDKFMSRIKVDSAFKKRVQLVKCALDLNDGRNINVYVRQRCDPGQPLRIYDVPTTLVTSEEVIEKIDSFWGTRDDTFSKKLLTREIASFHRAITQLIDNKLPDEAKPLVRIVQLGELETEMERPL